MSISEKWVNGIYSVATGSRFRKYLLTPIGFVLFITFVTGLIILSFRVDSLFGFQDFPQYPFNLVIGLPVIFFGVVLTLTCIIFFIKKKGTPVPLNPPKVLVTSGPYAYSRNPMLTGLFLQLSGFGIACGSITLAFIITPLFIILNVLEIKNIEEPELVKRLGNDYLEYKKRVPMFIPGFFKKIIR